MYYDVRMTFTMISSLLLLFFNIRKFFVLNNHNKNIVFFSLRKTKCEEWTIVRMSNVCFTFSFISHFCFSVSFFISWALHKWLVGWLVGAMNAAYDLRRTMSDEFNKYIKMKSIDVWDFVAKVKANYLVYSSLFLFL